MEKFKDYFAPHVDNAKIVVECDENTKRELVAYNNAVRKIRHDYQSRMKISYEKARGFCFSR